MLRHKKSFLPFHLKKKFDPYALPANPDFARIHRRATQFGSLRQMERQEFDKYTCPCCLLPANVTALGFREASLARIGRISLRAKEYFQTLLFFAAVLLVLFAASSTHLLVANPPIAKCLLSLCSDQSDALKAFYSSLRSEGSFRERGLEATMALVLLIIFGMKYWFLFFLVKQSRAHARASESVSKYSIHAHNLSTTSVEGIKREIAAAYNKARGKHALQPENIVEVSRPQNVGDHFALVSKLIDAVKKLKIAKIKRSAQQAELLAQIKSLRLSLLKLKQSKFLREALVIFDRQSLPQKLVTNKWERLFKTYFRPQLYFSRAMEPMDVIWEHFGDSERRRLLKILLSFSAAGLIILGGLTRQLRGARAGQGFPGELFDGSGARRLAGAAQPGVQLLGGGHCPDHQLCAAQGHCAV